MVQLVVSTNLNREKSKNWIEVIYDKKKIRAIVY